MLMNKLISPQMIKITKAYLEHIDLKVEDLKKLQPRLVMNFAQQFIRVVEDDKDCNLYRVFAGYFLIAADEMREMELIKAIDVFKHNEYFNLHQKELKIVLNEKLKELKRSKSHN